MTNIEYEEIKNEVQYITLQAINKIVQDKDALQDFQYNEIFLIMEKSKSILSKMYSLVVYPPEVDYKDDVYIGLKDRNGNMIYIGNTIENLNAGHKYKVIIKDFEIKLESIPDGQIFNLDILKKEWIQIIDNIKVEG